MKDCPGMSGNRFPYPLWEYPARFLWRMVCLVIWPLAWRRLYVLRPLLLRCFGARVSLFVDIHRTVRIERPWALQIGRSVTLGRGVTLYNLGGLSVGENTLLSQDVYVCGGTHEYADPSLPLVTQPVTIGSKVWICAGAFIGPGVTIGDGAVIGARAVVMKDVEPWTVVAGNPAKFVKRRELRAP
ncbi:MAG: hypothetical protein A2498_16860 [Lentisphaerae bacterium RIFOXYC12_FULL_60_16]|nr:MAG: hypothetical protein A2498_16860 [Lentisphaerae bacterium RIFOXYC12_FULL_60_16]OGV76253.1 MAG: hypothetical protein A2340_00170 [Lentisphaerae bacterium RIFOXYB12_FULL_60_10]